MHFIGRELISGRSGVDGDSGFLESEDMKTGDRVEIQSSGSRGAITEITGDTFKIKRDKDGKIAITHRSDVQALAACDVCGHDEHEPGQCANCNCGESQISRPQPGYGFSISDGAGGSRRTGGKRVGFDRNVDEN